MAKKISSFRISDDVKELLSKLAKLDDRSESYILEKLIQKEAERLKIK